MARRWKKNDPVPLVLRADQVALLLEVIENGKALHPADGMMLVQSIREQLDKARPMVLTCGDCGREFVGSPVCPCQRGGAA